MPRCLVLYLVVICLLSSGLAAWAHDLSMGNSSFVQRLDGPAVIPFLYLGAKHMFTGIDHLLFLLGVIFFLYRPRHIVLYVTLFTLGHSVTLVLGVWANWQVNEHLVDGIIGLSVVYKAFENMGGFQQVLKINPDPRIAVFVFGLCHGLGLATKLQTTMSSGDGMLVNLLSFNAGVELGQLLALVFILVLLSRWRRVAAFRRQAFALNTLVMCAGFLLAGNQFAGYLFA
ncbi:MAG: HupE/UreJ family protein [Halioglobus sp.]|nr:HupE/UreJ family protein [Halioglobus sp.]